MSKRLPLIAAALLFGAGVAPSAELRIAEGTNIAADVHAADGRIAMDLLGSIWVLPARGGDAELVVRQLTPAASPRWSPDGNSLLYESRGPDGSAIWRADLAAGKVARVTPAGSVEQDPAWHPSGERIVYTATNGGSGLDIYERDLATGLAWRLSSHAGDESAPAWSADGRHIAYVLYEDDRWSLVVRRFGRPPQVLLRQATPIHAPSWRPDNTLITYLAPQSDGRLALHMLILSDPPLERVLVSGEDLFIAPVSWRDRSQFVYTADGAVKTRHFEDRQSRLVPFSAAVAAPRERGDAGQRDRPLPPDTASGEIVVRAPRLYDGDSPEYRHDVDIVIRDGRIAAVETQRDRGDALVFDVGNVTVMPGLIDVYAGLPQELDHADGPRLLALGVTTLVSPDRADFDAAAWNGESMPGPRLLRAESVTATPARPGAAAERAELRLLTAAGNATLDARQRDRLDRWRRRGVPLLAENWNTGLAIGADMLLGSAALPASPRGKRYADVTQLGNGGPLLLVSAGADAATPGLAALLDTEPARQLAGSRDIARRFLAAPRFSNGQAGIVLGSRPSGLPPGIATQAELLALQAAGLPPYQALQAATGRAAEALQLTNELGRVVAGARADLLLVAGDPLANVATAREVVAVVRGGRFFSTASLLERSAQAVE